MMLFNSVVGEDSWESLGLQGDVSLLLNGVLVATTVWIVIN